MHTSAQSLNPVVRCIHCLHISRSGPMLLASRHSCRAILMVSFVLATLAAPALPPTRLNRGLNAAAAATYTIADLGTLPGYVSSDAISLSNNGWVTGILTTASGNQHAFLWSASTGMQDLGTLPGGTYSYAHDVNDSGVVVGEADTAGGKVHAFVWSANTGMQDLGGDSSVAYGINDANVVVGGYEDTSTGGIYHAFIWSTITNLVDLGTLPGGSASEAYAINANNQVVGYASASDGNAHAFLWNNSATGMTDLGTLGGSNSFAYDINNVGQVVGEANVPTGEHHAFLWTANGGMQDLGTLGGPSSDAKGINAHGQVVGASFGGTLGYGPFYWDATSGIVDLNTLLPPNSGWGLLWAQRINDSGQIVGSGFVNGDSNDHAYLMTPASSPCGQHCTTTIQTDKSQYTLGDTVHICYTIPQPAYIVMTSYHADGTSIVVTQGQVNSLGGCFNTIAGTVTSRDDLHLAVYADSTQATLIGQADTYFAVVPVSPTAVPTASPTATVTPVPTFPPSTTRAQAFYYPWYGNPTNDGAGNWYHWAQAATGLPTYAPPDSISSNFYPALGAYSSRDPSVLAQHMQWLREAGVGVLIYSWWGQRSRENTLVPATLAAAQAVGIKVAFQIEPYAGRTARSVVDDIAYIYAQYGSSPAFYRASRPTKWGPSISPRGVFYVYDSFTSIPDATWSAAIDTIRGTANDAIVLGQPANDASHIDSAHLDGLYTYDPIQISGSEFVGWAQTIECQYHSIFSPSVGPGFAKNRADPSAVRQQDRGNGARYDAMWQQAVAAQSDWVSITSFNEWHEGTQIEPAVPKAIPGYTYMNYDGTYGKTGTAASTAYLDRTAYWAAKLAANSPLACASTSSAGPTETATSTNTPIPPMNTQSPPVSVQVAALTPTPMPTQGGNALTMVTTPSPDPTPSATATPAITATAQPQATASAAGGPPALSTRRTTILRSTHKGTHPIGSALHVLLRPLVVRPGETQHISISYIENAVVQTTIQYPGRHPSSFINMTDNHGHLTVAVRVPRTVALHDGAARASVIIRAAAGPFRHLLARSSQVRPGGIIHIAVSTTPYTVVRTLVAIPGRHRLSLVDETDYRGRLTVGLNVPRNIIVHHGRAVAQISIWTLTTDHHTQLTRTMNISDMVVTVAGSHIARCRQRVVVQVAYYPNVPLRVILRVPRQGPLIRMTRTDTHGIATVLIPVQYEQISGIVRLSLHVTDARAHVHRVEQVKASVVLPVICTGRAGSDHNSQLRERGMH